MKETDNENITEEVIQIAETTQPERLRDTPPNPSGPYIEIVREATSEPLTPEELREANRPYWQSLARLFGERFATRKLEQYLEDAEIEGRENSARGFKIHMIRSRNLR
jgi:hypothetical protein